MLGAYKAQRGISINKGGGDLLISLDRGSLGAVASGVAISNIAHGDTLQVVSIFDTKSHSTMKSESTSQPIAYYKHPTNINTSIQLTTARPKKTHQQLLTILSIYWNRVDQAWPRLHRLIIRICDH